MGSNRKLFHHNCISVEQRHNVFFLINVLIDLADHSPIFTIESHANRITKSDIDSPQQNTLNSKAYSPSIAVSSSHSAYPQLEMGASILDIHYTFASEKSCTHLSGCLLFLLLPHNNFLTTYLKYALQTYFLMKYPKDKCAFSRLGYQYEWSLVQTSVSARRG